MEKSKDSAAASSKWSLSQYISDDDDSDTSDFRDDSVTTRSKLRSGRFRRSKELKAVVSEQTPEAMTNFKIPKKEVIRNLERLKENYHRKKSDIVESRRERQQLSDQYQGWRIIESGPGIYNPHGQT